MAQYWLDLTRSEAAILAEFEESSGIPAGYMSLKADPDDGLPSLYIGNSSVTLSGVYGFLWSEAPVSANMQVRGLLKGTSALFASTTRSGGVAARMSLGADSVLNGYTFGVDTIVRWELFEASDGVATQLSAGSTGDYPLDSYHEFILACSGTTVAGSSNGTQNVSITNSLHASGRAGLYFQRWRSANRGLYIRALSVGTDGDPAPTGPARPYDWFSRNSTPFELYGLPAGGVAVPTGVNFTNITQTSMRLNWS
jgi:hypothetical protein